MILSGQLQRRPTPTRTRTPTYLIGEELGAISGDDSAAEPEQERANFFCGFDQRHSAHPCLDRAKHLREENINQNSGMGRVDFPPMNDPLLLHRTRSNKK